MWYTFPILSSIQPGNISSTSKITLVESKYYELLFLLGKIKLIFYVLSSIVVQLVLDVVITVCFFGMFLVSIMDEKSKDVFIKLHYLNTTFKFCCGILYVLLAPFHDHVMPLSHDFFFPIHMQEMGWNRGIDILITIMQKNNNLEALVMLFQYLYKL